MHQYSGIAMWTAPYENLCLGVCGQRRPRSACAFAQSDQGLCCLLKEPLDHIECIIGVQMLTAKATISNASAQSDLDLHCLLTES